MVTQITCDTAMLAPEGVPDECYGQEVFAGLGTVSFADGPVIRPIQETLCYVGTQVCAREFMVKRYLPGWAQSALLMVQSSGIYRRP